MSNTSSNTSRAAIFPKRPPHVRIFHRYYIALVVIFVPFLISLVQTFISSLIIGDPKSLPTWDTLRQTTIGTLASNYPWQFGVIISILIVFAIIGWIIDRHSSATLTEHLVGPISGGHGTSVLPLVTALTSNNFRLGDDAAANLSYRLAPVQSTFEAVVAALRQAADPEVHQQRGAIILGVANAGKTRLAYEALRQALPKWYVLVWRPDDRTPDLENVRQRNLVVFIDDLQEHVPQEFHDDARGGSQSLDQRDIALRNMLQAIRGNNGAARVIVIATCRSEDEIRARARIEWLFDELTVVKMPTFPLDGQEAEQIINEFPQPEKHAREWDGTLGSLVLGLSTKRQIYLEMSTDRAPASRIIQAMKLLSIAGIELHTERRLRPVTARVFAVDALEKSDQVWEDAVNILTRLQFVTEENENGLDDTSLVIRKDAYFDIVVADYPNPLRPKQVDFDLKKLFDVLASLHDTDGMLYVGNAFYSRKSYREALEIYEALLKYNPRDAIIWRNKGSVLSKLFRYDEALAAMDKAIEYHPRYASAWRNKGSIFRSMRRFPEALEAYDTALKIDPEYAYAINGRGKVYYELHSYVEALVEYDQALEKNPNFAYFWRNKADALSALHRDQEALEAYDHAISLDQTYLYAMNGKAMTLTRLGRYTEASDVLRGALELNAQFDYAIVSYGNVLSELGQYDDALHYIDRALKINKRFRYGFVSKVRILRLLGRESEAKTIEDRMPRSEDNDFEDPYSLDKTDN